MERFTGEELALAKTVDLTAVAARLGYSVKRVGKYHTLKEMDSIRIYNRSSWFRWSREYEPGQNGGSQIDFLRVFAGMEVKEAVFWILEFMGYQKSETWEQKMIPSIIQKKEAEEKPFLLPVRANNCDWIYPYLETERGISKQVIDYFVNAGLIYEERLHHNIVFKGNNRNGDTLFASMRGVQDKEGKIFKCDVAGNNKNYGFNTWNENSHELIVFEAAIDLLSYTDIYSDFETNKLALGMLSDAPLVSFLQENPQIQNIKFCLDNDEPGRKAAETLMQKYYELGYEVENCPPPEGYKDYNEWLVEAKSKNLNQVKAKEMMH